MKEQDKKIERDFYENMFSKLESVQDGACIRYGYEGIYEILWI